MWRVIKTVANDRNAIGLRHVSHAHARSIIHVNDRCFEAMPRKQCRFGGFVLSHVAVIVQMVA